jgi:hypothetical protein
VLGEEPGGLGLAHPARARGRGAPRSARAGPRTTRRRGGAAARRARSPPPARGPARAGSPRARAGGSPSRCRAPRPRGRGAAGALGEHPGHDHRGHRRGLRRTETPGPRGGGPGSGGQPGARGGHVHEVDRLLREPAVRLEPHREVHRRRQRLVGERHPVPALEAGRRPRRISRVSSRSGSSTMTRSKPALERGVRLDEGGGTGLGVAAPIAAQLAPGEGRHQERRRAADEGISSSRNRTTLGVGAGLGDHALHALLDRPRVLRPAEQGPDAQLDDAQAGEERRAPGPRRSGSRSPRRSRPCPPRPRRRGRGCSALRGRGSCRTARISRRRPTTGPSSPRRASAVRSRPKRSRVGVSEGAGARPGGVASGRGGLAGGGLPGRRGGPRAAGRGRPRPGGRSARSRRRRPRRGRRAGGPPRPAAPPRRGPRPRRTPPCR